MSFSKKLVTFLLFCLMSVSAQADGWFSNLKVTPAPQADPNRPYNLVCFSEEGLVTVLDGVVNAQQFLRNDLGQTVSRKKMNKAGCDFAQIPPNSTARRAGFYQSEKGFIFPLFSVRYSTTDQTMYATDGIFLTKYWRLYTVSKRHNRMFGVQITPKLCEYIDGVVDLSGRPVPPDYIYIPPRCRTYTIR